MLKEEYIKNPSKASSLPFWKTNSITTNKKTSIIDKPYDDSLNKYYFKLVHYLNGVEKPILDSKFELVNISIIKYANHINSCYDNIHISCEELENYKNHSVYDDALCLAIQDKDNSKIVATGIAEIDKDIKEGTIEWVQVSKEYRRKGLGEYIVRELLYRLKDKATFVTVSGDCNNPSKPNCLYKKCGFTNETIWQIE